MSPRRIIEEHGRKITATGLVASLVGIVTLLTMMADLNGKLATSQNEAAGSQQYTQFLEARITALEKFTGIRRRKAVPAPPPTGEGLVRRVWHLIF
jgi:hypothetical protein